MDLTIGRRKINIDQQPYIIAEIGANHNGDMQLAKKMIKAAHESGCHCVKFQSWSKSSLFSKQVYEGNSELEKQIDQFTVTEKQLTELAAYSAELNIDFASTPFCEKEVKLLVDEIKVPFIKIASMDLTYEPFLKYVAATKLPVFLSTGLGELSEIKRAVEIIKGEGNNNIVLFHCVSLYPPRPEQINLNNIELLKETFQDIAIGFSDHSRGTDAALAAIAKGALVIEKHFTTDQSLPGWDHSISATPAEMTEIADQGALISKMLGAKERILTEEEMKMRGVFRRSVVASRDIPQGKVLELCDIDFKRPGTGLSPSNASELIGKKVKRLIRADEFINHEDV